MTDIAGFDRRHFLFLPFTSMILNIPTQPSDCQAQGSKVVEDANRPISIINSHFTSRSASIIAIAINAMTAITPDTLR